MTNRLLFTFALLITILSYTVAKEKSVVTLADPYILLDGDTYYAYGTGDADGIAVWTSKNLKEWTRQKELASLLNYFWYSSGFSLPLLPYFWPYFLP